MTLKPREPGVYFDLPAEEYHADPSLSFSGIHHLMLSPLAFWWHSPMNPDFDREAFSTPALRRGQAYHARILEGEEAFRARFYKKPVEADYPDALSNMPQMKKHLGDLGVKVPSGIDKKGLTALVRENDPNAQIWDDILAEAGEGRTELTPDDWAAIERIGPIIDHNPAAQELFSEGYPEVSVFWRDEETGVPLKIRLDWWARRWTTEVKTFSNPLRQDIDRRIINAITNERYRVQVALQREGIRLAVDLLTDEQRAFFNPSPNPDYVWLFVGTDIPHVRARGFPLLNRRPETGHASEPEQLQAGRIELRQAIKTYAACVEVYGTSMWEDREPIKELADSDFPVWSIANVEPEASDEEAA